MQTRLAKRIISALLCAVIVALTFGTNGSAPMLARAKETQWIRVNGTSYEPVTVYERVSSMTAGKTYLVDMNNQHYFADYNAETDEYLFINASVITAGSQAATNYYSVNDGTDKALTGDFYLDETGEEFRNSELTWNNSKLYNAANKKYLTYSEASGSANIVFSNNASNWSYANNRLSFSVRGWVSSTTYYWRYYYNTSTGNRYTIGTSTSGATVYPYEKKTAYRKVSVAGGYYKFSGAADYVINMGAPFDKSVLNSCADVFYKATEDGEVTKADLSAENFRLVWDKELDNNTPGVYTAKLYTDKTLLTEITVEVLPENSAVNYKGADPSTADVESLFGGKAADDGKVITDKSVQLKGDDFGAFDSYDGNEFSVTLSALAQSYESQTTVESPSVEVNHPDVVFIIDASGSMLASNVAGTEISRAEATTTALNNAIKELYQADPETRIGIVTFNFDQAKGVTLPLDKYTLPAGQTDYVLWGGRNIEASSTRGSLNGNYQTRTGSNGTKSRITIHNTYVGDLTDYYMPKNSECTFIATSNGVSYYDYLYQVSGNSDYYIHFIFADYQQCPIARLCANGVYTKDKVYVDENIRIEATGLQTLSYTTYKYSTANGRYDIQKETVDHMMSTNFLTNSAGETVAPSVYQFVSGQGTFTQAGLQAGENLYKAVEGDTENRTPVIVLISDGVPTVGDSNVNNPSLHTKDGVSQGIGLTTDTSDNLTNFGLWTIQTANKVKKEVSDEYGKSAKFFTIAPGVDYEYGQAILDPDPERLEKIRVITEKTDNSDVGNAIPSELYRKIMAAYPAGDGSYADLADYVDRSFIGDLSQSELNKAFTDIVKYIADANRPIAGTAATTTGPEAAAAMTFTDVIGENMQLTSAPVLVYNEKCYQAEGPETTVAQGVKTERYTFNGTVSEESTGNKISLEGTTVTVTTEADGKQTVRWYIPAELVPILVHNTTENTYELTKPIRLSYKVAMVDEKKDGTFYTNSTEEPAKAEFTPIVGNPYYYSNEKGSDGQMHSILKKDLNETKTKTENITETNDKAFDEKVNSDGSVTTFLGNNGKLTVSHRKVQVRKIWEDGSDTLQKRPESISLQLYLGGKQYGGPITVKGTDCVVTKDEKGNDVWTAVIEDLPDDGREITLEEISVDGYTTVLDRDGDSFTVTNSLPKVQVSYDLYLVDPETGEPIDLKGNKTSIDKRTVLSDTETVNVYEGVATRLDYDELLKLVPEGYHLYNPETSYTEHYNGKDSSGNSVEINDGTNTTYLVDPEETNESNPKINDYSDIHVIFAIVKNASINPDVVVIDYGLPVQIHVLENDEVTAGKVTGIALKTEADTVLGTEGYEKSKLLDGKTGSEALELTAGTAKIHGDLVEYTPKNMMMSRADVLYYECTAQKKHYYSTVTVVPATVMYYEDFFVDYEDTKNNKWNTCESLREGFQAEDRPGAAEVASDMDADNVYGYDDVNLQCNTYSLGSAHFVKVSDGDYAANGKKWPTAAFTFTGTAFDIISMTGGSTGFITVSVYKGTEAVGKAYKNWVVDCYYGYERVQKGFMKHEWTYNKEEAKWHVQNTVVEEKEAIPADQKLPSNEAAIDTTKTYITYEKNYEWTTVEDTSAGSNLYQIPVIKSTVLDYDTYTVVITPSYSTFFDHHYTMDENGKKTFKGSYEFYLDAIRVYAPAEDYEGYNKKYYAEDEEGWPDFIELRKNVIAASTVADGEAVLNNAVFIDSVASAANTEDYVSYGPNGEVYLSPGQSVAFALDVKSGAALDTIQLGAKRLAGEKVTLTVTEGSSSKTVEVNSNTDMYYRIADDPATVNGQTELFTVTNTGDEDSFVSLTTVKVTYKSNPAPKRAMMLMNSSLARKAMTVASAQYVNSVSECSHRYEYKVTKEPTENAEGERVGTCKDCGETVTEKLPVSEKSSSDEAKSEMKAEAENPEKKAEAEAVEKKAEDAAGKTETAETGKTEPEKNAEENKKSEEEKEPAEEAEAKDSAEKTAEEEPEEELSWIESIIKAVRDFLKRIAETVSSWFGGEAKTE